MTRQLRPGDWRVLAGLPTRPGDDGWTTALALAANLGLEHSRVRQSLRALLKEGFAERELAGRSVVDHYRYKVTPAGLTKLRQRRTNQTQRPENANRVDAREQHMDRPDRTKVARLPVGSHTVTLKQYKAWAAKVGDRMTATTLSQPLGTRSQSYQRKASKGPKGPGRS